MRICDTAPPADLIERVADLIEQVSASVIETRFIGMTEAEVREKSPGELVTDADEEGERQLTARLEALWPGSGRERRGCSTDPWRAAASQFIVVS